MKTTAIVLAGIALAGCGGGGSDPLQGEWIINNPGASCALQFAFHGDMWEADQLCNLTDGSTAVEIDGGAYTSAGHALTLTTDESSCAGFMAVTKTESGTFAVQGSSLSLTFGTNILVLQRVTGPPTGQGAATIGCFDGSGNFTANPVGTVP